VRFRGDVTRCEREAAFAPMWDALGDWQRQQQIRAAHPDDRHCQLLLANCNACVSCPFSPYSEEGGADKLVADENQELFAEASTLHGDLKWGIVKKEDLTSTEALAMDIYERETNYVLAEQQAKLTAIELSKIFRSQEN
jgi:hypothetical protein